MQEQESQPRLDREPHAGQEGEGQIVHGENQPPSAPEKAETGFSGAVEEAEAETPVPMPQGGDGQSLEFSGLQGLDAIREQLERSILGSSSERSLGGKKAGDIERAKSEIDKGILENSETK